MPMMLLLFACGLAVAQSATTQTTPTTAPTTRPYAGLTLRDDPSGKVLVSHIAPGPLEGRGFKSPHLFRGDTILAINGAPMTAKHFEELVERSHVGDEITIQVKRTGNGTVSAVPEPTMLDGKVEEFRFTLADQLEWVGPVGHPNPRSMHDVVDAIDRRVAPSTAPTEFESFVERQLAANRISKPIDDLEKLLIKTQQDDWGFNSLGAVAYGFNHPRRLPRLEKLLTDPLPAIVADPRQILVQAAQMIDVEPTAFQETPDLSDPQKALEWFAQHLNAANTATNRAFAGLSATERASLPASIQAILYHVAKPATLDSAANASHVIKTLQSTMRIDYHALFSAAAEMSGCLNASPLAASQTKSVSPIEIPKELDGAVTGPILAATKSPSGWIIYGSTETNTYDLSRIAGVIDPGGDDLFRLSLIHI